MHYLETDVTGEPLRITGDDPKNKLAWFAFERVAFNLIGELGL